MGPSPFRCRDAVKGNPNEFALSPVLSRPRAGRAYGYLPRDSGIGWVPNYII
jgi:hypothetical protein